MSTGTDPHPAGFQGLVEGQSRALELGAAGGRTEEALELLVRTAEAAADGGFLGSILVLDEDGRRLRHGAAPSLPVAYSQAIDGIEIGPGVGSCGTAAHFGHAIVVTDIAADPLWEAYRELALQHGLRACWSTPFLARDGSVLGTFALYYPQPRCPSERDREIVKITEGTAALIVENARLASRIRELSEGARLAAEAGDLGFFTWDIESDTVRWQNDKPYDILGIPRTEGPVSASRFVSEFLHPDDREAFSSQVALALEGGRAFHFVGRIRNKATGGLLWMEVAGRMDNFAGRRAKVVGIVADVTSRHAS